MVKVGIYVVESPRGERPRAVVIATSAQSAAQWIGNLVGMTNAEIGESQRRTIGQVRPWHPSRLVHMVDGSRPPNIITDDGIAAEYPHR